MSKNLADLLHRRLDRTAGSVNDSSDEALAGAGAGAGDFEDTVTETGSDIERAVPLGEVPPLPVPEVHLVYVDPHRVRLNPQNFRSAFDDEKVESMAASMRLEGIGVIEPVIARPVEITEKGRTDDGCDYEGVAGDNRILASRRAGVWLPLLVRHISDRVARRINWIENIQRADELNAVDASNALMQLRRDLEEELAEWTTQLRSIRGAEPEKPGDEPTYWENAVDDLSGLPLWIERVFERAVRTERRPKVNWEDVGFMSGMQERNLYHWKKVANLEDDVKEEVRQVGLNMHQARAVESLTQKAQQRRLVREIAKNGLSGHQAFDRARDMNGKPPRAKQPASSLKTSTATVAALAAQKRGEPVVPQGSPHAMLEHGVRLWESASQLLAAGYADPKQNEGIDECLERMSAAVDVVSSTRNTSETTSK